MITFLFTLLLTRFIKEETEGTTKTLFVRNFYDYSVILSKKNDCLSLSINPATLVFVSAKDGYRFKTSINSDETIFPSTKKRLMYFHVGGFMNVYAEIDDLNFTFHSLCLRNIKHEFDMIYVSSNPEEVFNINNANEYSNSNGTFNTQNLIWLIGNSYVKTVLDTHIYEDWYDFTNQGWHFEEIFPVYYAFPFTNPNNESDVDFTKVRLESNQVLNLNSYSKLIYIDKPNNHLTSKKANYFKIRCILENLETNYYADFRALAKYSELTDQIIERGQFRYDIARNYIPANEGSLVEFDFSIFKQYYTDTPRHLYIFPQLSEMSTNLLFNDKVICMVREFNQNPYFKSGNDSYVAETDFNVKVVTVDIMSDPKDMVYIISTSPTEKLVIKNQFFDGDRNYSSNVTYKYIMASVQNTRTNVSVWGEAVFYKIDYDYNKLIEKVSLGNLTIDGPFIAELKENGEYTFETYPIGEL